MSSPVNPIVSGLLHGFQLAHQMKQERLQQEALQRGIQRDQEDKQVRDLQTRLALSDRGYKPSSPDQEAEALTGFKAGVGPTGPLPSDIKSRMVDFQGTKYVGPSQDELDVSSERATQRDLGRKVKEAKALGDVKTQQVGAETKAKMDVVGLPISDEVSGKLGLKPGGRIMQGPGFAGGIGALMRSIAPPKVSPPRLGQSVNKTGDVTPTAVSLDANGNPKIVTGEPARGIASKPDKKEAGLSPYQQTQIKRQQEADARRAKLDAAKEQGDAQKQVDALNKQEQLLHQENRDIGARLLAGSKGTATDKKGKSVKVTPEDATALKAKLADNQSKVKALQDRQHGIIMKFAGGSNPNDPAGILGAQ